MKKIIGFLSLMTAPLSFVHGVEEDFAAYYDASAFWPYKVAVKQKETISNGESGTQLHPGIPGVLLYLDPQSEHAVIDFGRKGVHSLPLTQTNFEEGWLELREGKEKKLFPNLINSLGNKTYRYNGETLQRLAPEHFDPVERLALLYVDPDDPKTEELLGEIHAKYLAENSFRHEMEVIMLPSRNDLNPLFSKVSFTWPTVIFEMSYSFYQALGHNPDTLPCIVITDKEGKIEYHSLMAETPLSSLLELFD